MNAEETIELIAHARVRVYEHFPKSEPPGPHRAHAGQTQRAVTGLARSGVPL
jgi:hypothetical protein